MDGAIASSSRIDFHLGLPNVNCLSCGYIAAMKLARDDQAIGRHRKPSVAA
jgi:hypothetical protein